jgi:hypothetical protein
MQKTLRESGIRPQDGPGRPAEQARRWQEGAPETETSPLSIDLVARQRLEVERAVDRSQLTLLAPDGRVSLRIEIRPEGPILHLDGPGLKIEVNGDLSIAAGRLALTGREALSLQSGGDLRVEAAGAIESQGLSQSLTARLGDITVKANDDLHLKGERLRLNC